MRTHLLIEIGVDGEEEEFCSQEECQWFSVSGYCDFFETDLSSDYITCEACGGEKEQFLRCKQCYEEDTAELVK